MQVLSNVLLAGLVLLVSNPLLAQTPPVDSSELSLLFIGDIMGHGSQIRSAHRPESDTYDYSGVFEYLQPELEAVDFAIANLEVTLAGPPFKGYPQFSSPDDLAVAARDHGIDVLVTANNHSADRRGPGIQRTIEVLDSLNIQHTGTFVSAAERRARNLLVLEKKGWRVGVLNYTFSTNGIPVPDPYIVNMLDREQMREDIRLAQRDSLDQLVVFVHWGREYEHQPYSTQTSLASYLLDLGVDLVIGAHPHVLQPMAWEKRGAQDQVVVYSLGNFVSNQRDPGRDGGGMFEVTLARQDGRVAVKEAGYHLIWVYKRYEGGKLHFHVVPGARFEHRPEFFVTEGAWDQFQEFMRSSRRLLDTYNYRIGEYRYYGGLRYNTRGPLLPLPRTDILLMQDPPALKKLLGGTMDASNFR